MNRSITLTLPHSLPKAEARRRVDEALAQAGQQLTQIKIAQFRKDWQGDRLNFLAQMLGQEVAGHVEILDQGIKLEVSLPALFALMAEAVRGRLQSEGRKLLAKNAG